MGSSPLTRGKHFRSSFSVCRGRLIPAHAGKTGAPVWQWRIRAAHPRSRGENQERDHDGHRPRWLIPAHAGKTVRGARPHSTPEAHPRSRGENILGCQLRIGRPGSSPLTRGKHAGLRGLRGYRGLIPAHAGKTHSGTAWPHTASAHPRSRGENFRGRRARSVQRGSSPLTRGKLRSLGSGISSTRLIPAHAGKTARQRPRP